MSGDLAGELAGQRILLVLDNLEQVLDCAGSLADLIAHTSDVRVLVTSREPLDIGAERRYQVPLLEREAAIELFNDRADAVGAAVDDEEEAVAMICERLEGLPLAVELAAARTAAFSASELLSRLEARPGILDELKTGCAGPSPHASGGDRLELRAPRGLRASAVSPALGFRRRLHARIGRGGRGCGRRSDRVARGQEPASRGGRALPDARDDSRRRPGAPGTS